ncbi:hypothetical protein BDF20DRAFT_916425 [Mycotypha africana]|uniref:uncharacterized protein n=1 Tax=Mycotypha africana TaxID=64632 RepID=UPI002300DFAF|nr:uncharacterized protein BDF20DRAFT_916425 [Mycotypha africana]KAI8969011.1 hypothetical protein BDF20DRAFT_916425 [Mycotypha africana]
MKNGKQQQQPSDTTLTDYLWQTPLYYNCQFDETVKLDILSHCFAALWKDNKEFMQKYFFQSIEELRDVVMNQSRRRDGKERNVINDPKLWHTNALIPPTDLSNQKGRQCGHVFRKGEPVYRCRNCGLDDTCVFCSKCFHATNHDGHDIFFSISPGSGGCCDCGDPEAWKVPLQCKIHSAVGESEQNNYTADDGGTEKQHIEPELIDSIRNTVASVLNFLLDIFALAPDEITLNASSEDIIRENLEQRHILNRMGIPSQLANTTTTAAAMANQVNTRVRMTTEEDVEMDNENNQQFNNAEASSSASTSQSTNDLTLKDGELYACIVWNDEAHAFSHVLESIMTATGWDWEKAKQIVDVIHVHGREIIAVSKNIEELRKIAAPLSAINLSVTIRPAKETFREQVAGLLVEWLNELVSGNKCFFTRVKNGDAIIRGIIYEELCREWELRLPLAILTAGARSGNAQRGEEEDEDEDGVMKDDMAMSISDIVEDVEMFEPDSDSQMMSKDGSPDSGASTPILYRSQCDVATIDWDPASMVREYNRLRNEEIAFGDYLLDNRHRNGKQPATKPENVYTYSKEAASSALIMQREFGQKLRLDYFMLYDLKLWKEVRISLRELYIATLASNAEYKKTLGKRLARNYARLAESFLLRDREPENSIILFSVQLLTVPTVSDLLVHDYYFFGLICSTLTAFFLTDRLYLLLPSERAKYPARINCESRAFRTRRYFNAFHDLRYIMNVEMIKRELAEDPLYLRQYLDLISLFQGMNAQVCQKDTHVEYESEIWVNAFNVTLQIAKCCRQFADCFGKLSTSTKEEKISSAIIVCRAISRLLKRISDWGSEEANGQAKTSDSIATTSPKVEGIAAQIYHTISLRYTEPFEIIKYDVASQPVSFHHPLHWLLAGVLEYAHLLDNDTLKQAGWDGGFKKMIVLFSETRNASPSILLPILDYPIRTIVFSSQIRAGVWVRNGYGIRNQAHHYRDISLRENTYDADVFLLQFGFVTIPSNRFLATLLDRFNLVDWFMGKQNHDTYDSTQLVFMVEDLLNLLIVIISERANIDGMSITDKVRREIVHNLCLGSSAYSDLSKRIPERIAEHPEFDRILLEVANFKSPEGVNDHGVYELKDDYFSMIDTYFWHFNRNNREEAETILRSRWKKENPHRDEKEFFVLPQHIPIAPGPFQHLGSFLQSTVFVQMMAFALWNIYTGDTHKSDTILDQVLHLVMLAMTDKNSEDVSNFGQGKFFDYVCSLYFIMEVPQKAEENAKPKTSRKLCLFEILAELYDQEQYAEIKSRLKWIFEELLNKGVENTRTKVYDWKAKRAAQLEEEAKKSQNSGTKLSEVEKKKLAAKERQKKIMAQFAQAQSQFMEKNEFLYDEEVEEDEEETFVDAPDNLNHAQEESSDSIHRFCSYPTGTCIVCQEDANERSMSYGLLGLIQTSNILRGAPMDDESLFNDIYQMGSNLDTEWQDHQCLPNGELTVSGFPAKLHKTGLYASTCGHFMHIKCFEVYCSSIDSRHTNQLTRNHPENRSRKEFMCPLCKSLGNALLPVFWKGKKESYPGVLSKSGGSQDSAFYETQIGEIVGKLKHTVVSALRNAQLRKNTRDVSATNRMKDVMAQLLPNLPVAALVAPMPGRMPANREWTPTTFPARLPIPTPVDTNTNNPQIGADNTINNNMANLTNIAGQAGLQVEELLHPSNIIEEMDRDAETMFIQNALNSSSLRPPDGRLGPFENGILHSTAMTKAPFIRKSYRRLCEVLSTIYQEICSNESEREMSTAAENVDMLWGMMGYTIAGVEIATRGNKSTKNQTSGENATTTHTLFDQIPSQTQILLRILSDTVMAYTTIMCPRTGDIKTSSPSIPMARVNLFSLGRMRQLFKVNIDDIVAITAGSSQKLMLYENAPLLEDDPFMILTEIAHHIIPLTQADIFPFIQILLLAEFAKIAVGLLQDRLSRDISSQQSHQTAPIEPSQNITAACSFAFSLMQKLQFTSEEAQSTFKKFGSEASFCALLKFFALPFLRRTLILLIVRFGLIVPPMMETTDTAESIDEIDRLMEILRLPKFADFLQPTPYTDSLLNYWCEQHIRGSEHQLQVQEGHVGPLTANQLLPIQLDLPTPLHLVALPERLDSLFAESMKRVCQKCGTVPSDPALCLLCGTFVCAQSFCCAEDEEGECNLHTLECGGEIGLFLSVKRCVLIMLHNGNGWFMNAPYLDPHGEVDQGLSHNRHGRPQYLNAKRYAEIRKLWLQHNIPIYVARQIEANYDIGGWTTL